MFPSAANTTKSQISKSTVTYMAALYHGFHFPVLGYLRGKCSRPRKMPNVMHHQMATSPATAKTQTNKQDF
jgi:hypothetical protein